MADYLVTLTFPINITASTEEVAQKRAEDLQERMSKSLAGYHPPWMGDLDMGEIEVECQE
ncbi:MAG TPA: hypothetical protein VI855_06955 [Dehalococcoidia bacterium]|nr:hypothetical protein [Dehalococcoidia bacterium]